MKSESREGAMERTFSNYHVGQQVLVNGCPGRIVSVTFDRLGCIIVIEVNGSQGDYTPVDFTNGIIELIAVETQEQVL